MKIKFFLFAVVLFFVLMGCVQESKENTPQAAEKNATVSEAKAPLPQPKAETEKPVKSIEKTDNCGNEIGNGEEIVSGPAGPIGPDRDNPFRSLTVHPKNPNIVYLGTERNGFVKSSDGGKNWERLRHGLWHDESGYPEIYDIAISETNPEIIFAVTTSGGPGPLIGNYPTTGGGIYKSTDKGKTWQRKNCGITNAWAWSVLVDKQNPENVVVGISGGKASFTGSEHLFFDGGIFISTDGGEYWKKAEIAENDEKNIYAFIKPHPERQGYLYIFAHSFESTEFSLGFAKSKDFGKTWELFAPELKQTEIGAFEVSNGTLYAVDQTNLKIWKSLDDGERWKSFDVRTSIYGLAVSPTIPNRVLFATKNTIFLSTDGLETAAPVLENIEKQMSGIVFAPTDPSIVYAVTQGYSFYKSEDSGKTWKKIKDIRNEVLNVVS